MRAFRALRVLALSLVAALCAFSTTSCGQDFDPGSRVTDLRVLAISADARWDGTSAPSGQSWAKPGETVQLQALWYDPPTDLRGRTWVWARCVDPDSTTVVGCLATIALELQRIGADPAAQQAAFARGDSPFLTLPPLDTVGGVDIPHVAVTVPTDALTRLPEEARRNATVGVLAIVCPGKVVVNLDQLGNLDTLPLQCLEDGTNRNLPLDEWVIGIKRIFVRDVDRNGNPEIVSVTWDGVEWPESEVKEVSPCDAGGNRFDRCSDQEHHDVSLTLSPESFESGTDGASGTPFTEQLIVQYYATEGIFEDDVRVARDSVTSWAARTEARDLTDADGKKNGIVTMWLIARDNRGGVSFAMRKIHVN